MTQLRNGRLSPRAVRLIRSARIAHLATADASGQPHVVPICFVFDGARMYSPIDEKPKRAPASQLKRIRNIGQNPDIALVIDHYEEDWRKLAYVLIFGTARLLSGGAAHRRAARLLRRKYPQYRLMDIDHRPMIRITPRRSRIWGDL